MTSLSALCFCFHQLFSGYKTSLLQLITVLIVVDRIKWCLILEPQIKSDQAVVISHFMFFNNSNEGNNQRIIKFQSTYAQQGRNSEPTCALELWLINIIRKEQHFLRKGQERCYVGTSSKLKQSILD